VRAEQALPKTTSEQGGKGDPQVRPRFRAVRRCGDAAIRPPCVGEADARVRMMVPMPMPCTRATSRGPRAGCINRTGAALSRAHLIIPATFPPSHLQSALIRLVLLYGLQ
jgi:hypothetical protein